jgi:hypothetical protein
MVSICFGYVAYGLDEPAGRPDLSRLSGTGRRVRTTGRVVARCRRDLSLEQPATQARGANVPLRPWMHCGPLATMTATRRRTNSAASSGSRSSRPSRGQRCSMTKVRPSRWPRSRNPCRISSTVLSEVGPATRGVPMRGTLAGCARAASGFAIAPTGGISVHTLWEFKTISRLNRLACEVIHGEPDLNPIARTASAALGCGQ